RARSGQAQPSRAASDGGTRASTRPRASRSRSDVGERALDQPADHAARADELPQRLSPAVVADRRPEHTYPARALRLADERVETEPQELEVVRDRKSTRLNSSHVKISYAVFCLKKKR